MGVLIQPVMLRHLRNLQNVHSTCFGRSQWEAPARMIEKSHYKQTDNVRADHVRHDEHTDGPERYLQLSEVYMQDLIGRTRYPTNDFIVD